MSKMAALWALFRKGQAVADPAKWKARQIETTALAAALLAVVQVLEAFGYALPVDADTATAVAAGVIAVVNVVLTVTTTDKIGLPSVGDPASGNDPHKDPGEPRRPVDERYLG